MTEVEEPRFTTLAERIAALNQQKNFQAPPPVLGKRPPPPPPPNRPASSQAVAQVATNRYGSKTTTPQSPSIPSRPVRTPPVAVDSAPPLPRRTTNLQNGDTSSTRLPARDGAPALPTRSSTAQESPALPPRRPSAQTLPVRRNSNASDISYMSTMSILSLNNTVSSATSVGSDQPTRRLPPTLDHVKLPPLLPTHRELEARAKEEAVAQATRAPLHSIKSAPSVPSLPPRLPSRPTPSPAADQADEQRPALPARRTGEQSPAQPARRMPPPSSQPSAWNRAKSAMDTARRGRQPDDDAPPPVPQSSRPTFAQIDAVATRAASSTRSASAHPSDNPCLYCRDFSGPDDVAAKYPLSVLPRNDPVGFLAHHLCSPFSSPTDKARAIFTWCHHNVAYDVDGFFNKCIPRGQTLDQTIFSGKAVCEGYAKVYEGIAQRAGLDCVLVSGHGKGYGFTALAPGQRPPPKDATGHAWNAVRINGGEWKLLDACWGAGSVDKPRYIKGFNPSMFAMSNEEFFRKHFPTDERHFYLPGGRIPTWEEYIVEPVEPEPATWYSNAAAEGFTPFNASPKEKQIPVRSGEVLRFQLGKVCAHCGREKERRPEKPLLLLLKITGPDGRGVRGKKDDMVPLENDGVWWWVDIPARDLGAPGEKLSLLALTSFNNEDARGMTKEKFFTVMSNGSMRSMSWDGVIAWELV